MSVALVKNVSLGQKLAAVRTELKEARSNGESPHIDLVKATAAMLNKNLQHSSSADKVGVELPALPAIVTLAPVSFEPFDKASKTGARK